MGEYQLVASPVRVIPFDLGRSLDSDDVTEIKKYAVGSYDIGELTNRQLSIIKQLSLFFTVNENLSFYIYEKGICVVVVHDRKLSYKDATNFSVSYCQDRKDKHRAFFDWKHEYSSIIFEIITELKTVIRKNTSKKERLRPSSSDSFENKGLSYVMTLSFFSIEERVSGTTGYSGYPNWLKRNVCALLEPSLLYLADSDKFGAEGIDSDESKKLLEELSSELMLKDYERHRHIGAYMSWAAVVVIGRVNETDIIEYCTLEVQLQSDWFYVYCCEKTIDGIDKPRSKDVVYMQKQQYELDMLKNRLYDFDDSSLPLRIVDIQRGLVDTSNLEDNIEHLRRKTQYILERENLNAELHQKRIGQSTEILLFIIAFIEIAPTVAEYGNKLFPYGGTIANIVMVILGMILLIFKNR